MRRLFLLLPLLALTGCDGCSKPKSDVESAAPSLLTIADAAPINATALPTASVAAMVNPDHLPAYAGATGSVEGAISVTGDPAPETPGDFKRCPDAANMFGHAFREGEPKTGGGPRWLADAVVAVTGYGGFYVREKLEEKELTIKGCGYDKRTLTLTFGQRLDVKNLTQEFWTPMLEPGSNKVMLMATPGGDPVKIYPKAPGYYRLIDHDRKYAIVDVYAFLHPLHTVSDTRGAYRIDGIPVGKVKVNTSHPRISGVEAAVDVEIKEGVVHRVDLTLDQKRPAPSQQKDSGASPPPH